MITLRWNRSLSFQFFETEPVEIVENEGFSCYVFRSINITLRNCCSYVVSGVVKYGDSIILIGGEDDRSWMAGMCTLREDNGIQSWIAGVELPIVMSTFGCVVANISKKILDDWLWHAILFSVSQISYHRVWQCLFRFFVINGRGCWQAEPSSVMPDQR